MPADVGAMFYTGETPWHGLGRHVDRPLALAEAIAMGDLDWEVGSVDLLTADCPPSPVRNRKAIVRLDRPNGDPDRVLGVAHRDFRPIQNQWAGRLFDATFGEGKALYHTGGYLGGGQVIWLLAKLDRPFRIGTQDWIEPYALMINSHDGSIAFSIRLTTIRVVCRNTLNLAIRDTRLGLPLRRSHQGPMEDHARAAVGFYQATLRKLGETSATFQRLSMTSCPDDAFAALIVSLFPLPPKPQNPDRFPGLLRSWERRTEAALDARKRIQTLKRSGQGMQLEGADGTCWGALNAITEFVDHHQQGPRLASALLGEGAQLKARAYQVICEWSVTAA